jgi:predicted helicase
MLLYYSNQLNERSGIFNSFFLTKDTYNLIISISSIASKNEFSVLINNNIVDFHYLENTRCFSLYI